MAEVLVQTGTDLIISIFLVIFFVLIPILLDLYLIPWSVSAVGP